MPGRWKRGRGRLPDHPARFSGSDRRADGVVMLTEAVRATCLGASGAGPRLRDPVLRRPRTHRALAARAAVIRSELASTIGR